MQSVYKGKFEETIYTLSIKLYGDVKYFYKLFSENISVLENINSTVEGVNLVYDTDFKGEVSEPLEVNSAVKLNLSQTYLPRYNQSIFDIALQIEGGLEGVVGIVFNSSLGNINNRIDSTDYFNYQMKTNRVLDWVAKNKIIFTTGRERNSNREHDNSFSTLSFT